MLKPIGFLACALVFVSLSARPGAAGPGAAPGEPARAAASSAPARTAPATAVDPHPAAAAPVITSISPAVLEPGGEATITGTGFSSRRTSNIVTVDGVRVRVETASDTQLVVELPPGEFECRPQGPVPVVVGVSRAADTTSHLLRTAHFVELQPGGVATPDEFTQANCLELGSAKGRYWVGVVNTDKEYGNGYMLRGRGGRLLDSAIHPLAMGSGPVDPLASRPTETAAAAMADSAWTVRTGHLDLLAQERDRVSERRARGIRPPPALAGVAAQPRPLPRVGDLQTMRIWKKWGDCSTYDEVTARVVYVGARAIIFEDRAAPQANRMNADYQSLGAEFDTLMWGIVTQNFGNPLAKDDELDDDGRVRMLFTPRVAVLDSTVFAYVTSCDFYEREEGNLSSNKGEVFYAQVPKTQADRPRWLREARALTIHEVKHLAAYAERLDQPGGDLEYAWLEEGTAMVAQELYARAYTRVLQSRNAAFGPGLGCEYSTDAACGRVPLAMGSGFTWLYDYLYEPEAWSPLHRGLKTYGAAWSMVRWAADQSPRPEAEFFSSLTRNITAYGAENLANHAGRRFPELIVDWHIAAAMDDAGYPPPRPELDMPSWNTRDVFRGLHRARPRYFDRPFPLGFHWRHFGTLVVRSADLPSASAMFTEIGGIQTRTQILELRNADGSARADSIVRMFIIRMD